MEVLLEEMYSNSDTYTKKSEDCTALSLTLILKAGTIRTHPNPTERPEPTLKSSSNVYDNDFPPKI